MPATNSRFVSASCIGETCRCGAPAEHKVEETIFMDDPQPVRHPLVAYICHRCFVRLMRPYRLVWDAVYDELLSTGLYSDQCDALATRIMQRLAAL